MSERDVRAALLEMAQKKGSIAYLAEILGLDAAQLIQTVRGGQIRPSQASALGLEICYRAKGSEIAGTLTPCPLSLEEGRGEESEADDDPPSPEASADKEGRSA
jgi:hypothetical protein